MLVGPFVCQWPFWKAIWPVRMQVRPLALLSVLRILKDPAVAQAVVQTGSCSSISTPSLGTSTCCRCGSLKKKEKKERERNKQTQRHGEHGEQTCDCRRGEEASGMDWEFGVSRYKLSHLEWISRSYCIATGNYIHFLLIENDGK